MSLNNPVTPPEIDPGTVRLIAQRLNHYATPGPSNIYVVRVKNRSIKGKICLPVQYKKKCYRKPFDFIVYEEGTLLEVANILLEQGQTHSLLLAVVKNKKKRIRLNP
jgi:hypothetical protein